MNIEDTPTEAAHRARVRSYLADNADRLVHGLGGEGGGEDRIASMRQTQRVLADGGLVGITWPTEHGGGGGSTMDQVIIDQELERAGIPALIGQIGIGMCGPTIIAHGSQHQQRLFLARLLRADDIWAQMFSEPGSGSDLAGLTTRATAVEGGWRVSGQKVWTSGAQWSAWAILLVRTDPGVAKHRGLSMLILDMAAPGVTIRPLRQMSGDSGFSEVFLDDVFVPAEHVLGAVGDGWRVALTTLMNERVALGGSGGDLGVGIEQLLELARRRLPELSPDEQARLRQELGGAYADTLAARMTGWRRLTALSKGADPGPEASAGKLAGIALARRVADLGVRLQGEDAVFAASSDGDQRWQYVQTLLPGLAIAGGTDEVLKNILGERVLGLAAEPRSDKNVPFRPERTLPSAPSPAPLPGPLLSAAAGRATGEPLLTPTGA